MERKINHFRPIAEIRTGRSTNSRPAVQRDRFPDQGQGYHYPIDWQAELEPVGAARLYHCTVSNVRCTRPIYMHRWQMIERDDCRMDRRMWSRQDLRNKSVTFVCDLQLEILHDFACESKSRLRVSLIPFCPEHSTYLSRGGKELGRTEGRSPISSGDWFSIHIFELLTEVWHSYISQSERSTI